MININHHGLHVISLKFYHLKKKRKTSALFVNLTYILYIYIYIILNNYILKTNKLLYVKKYFI